MAKGFYSRIYKIETNDFKEIVKTSSTYTEILRKCGFENKGCNVNTLKRRLKFEKINTDHIQKGYNHNKGQVFLKRRISLEDALENYFIVNSQFKIATLKKLIYRFKLKEYKCNICSMKPVWENKPLSLPLDHINGKRNDNRLENLRFLCPNCHSQTETFAGKSTRKIYKCKKCGDEIWKKSDFCIKCFGITKRKIERPFKEILEKEILETPIVQLGKKYNVSDNSIRKWCKSYNIFLPSMRGYWQKKSAGKI
jgi:Zn finger protein HypA/HybF involved in hydrogenase expression